MATSGPCNVCKNTSSSRCSRCKAVFYCGAEHQKADWPTHSKQCKAASAASAAASPAKTAWNPPKVVSAPVAKDHVATFRRWLEENGVKGLDKVGIADFEQTGRGLKALKTIEADSVVLEIPRPLFLTTSDTVRNHPELVKVFSDYTVWSTISQMPDSILALRLLFEKHSAMNSPWKPWIEVLPKRYNSTIFWTNRELDLIRGTNLHQITVILKQQLESEYATLFKQILAKRFPLIFKPSLYTQEEYFWAMATVHSRATDGHVDGGDQRYIVPFMDMANHSFEAQCSHKFDSASNSFRFVAKGGIAQDEQVFINYGPMGNAKLLQVYGFTCINNPYEYIQMVFHMGANAELYEQKKKILAAQGLPPSPTLYIRLDQLDLFPLDVLGTVRTQRLTEGDLATAGNAFHREEVVSVENEVVSLKALEDGLTAMWKAIVFPHEKDLELAEAFNKGTSQLSPNEMNALNLRMGDRLVIGKAGGLITEMLEMVRDHLKQKITENMQKKPEEPAQS